MKKLILPFLAATLLLSATGAFAQGAPAPALASDATNLKLAKLDLLIKLVPLIIRKDQFPALLSGIDQARAIKKKEQDREDKILADMDAQVTETVDNAIEKGIYPPTEVQNSIAEKLRQMRSRQVFVGADMNNAVYNAIKPMLDSGGHTVPDPTRFDDGQMKILIKGFSDTFVEPSAKPGDVKDDIKTMFFIKNIFLDPLCYDLLVELSKHAN